MSLLAASLCLFALQFLPYHLLAEHHEPASTVGHTHEGDSHHSDDHGSPASGHTSVSPQPGTRFDPAVSLPIGVIPGVLGALAPPAVGCVRVAVLEVSVPPPPDLGPAPARGPPPDLIVG